MLLAALGARVVLTDLASLDSVVSGNISMNLSAIRPPASANFCPLDWTRRGEVLLRSEWCVGLS